MTVSGSINRRQVSVSGYDYDFNFKIFTETEIEVYGVDADGALTQLVYETDFVVTISSIIEGGTVQTGSYVATVWTPAEPSYTELLMIRKLPYTQTANIPTSGGFDEATIETALDRLEMQVQQLKDAIDYVEGQDPLAVASAVASAAAAAASAAEAAAILVKIEGDAGDIDTAIATAINTALDVDTGHHHDGADSRVISYNDLIDVPVTAIYFEVDHSMIFGFCNAVSGLSLGKAIALTPASLTEANLATGKVSKACYDFDGTSDYVTVADDTIFEGGVALTIEAWLYKDVTGEMRAISDDGASLLAMKIRIQMLIVC
jgi:hypothetical protein